MNSSSCCTTANQTCGCDTASQPASAKAPTYLPSVDVHETADAIVITADVPGAKSDGVDLTFEDSVLTLRAAVSPRKHEASRRPAYREYGVGDYVRKFSVREAISAERIGARLADGVLTITLPKADSVRPRKIRIEAANN